MQLTIEIQNIPILAEKDIANSLRRVLTHWGDNILGKPITSVQLNNTELSTHKFIDSIKTIPPSTHHYWGRRMPGLYLESVFLGSRQNDHIHQSPFKPLFPIWWGCDMCKENEQHQEPAIQIIFVSSKEFDLIESENQLAFITNSNNFEVGKKIAIQKQNAGETIIVEIDEITQSKSGSFINEFHFVDLD